MLLHLAVISTLIWDESKRLSNLAKHGFDFLRAVDVLEGQHVVLSARQVGQEERFLAIGVIGGRYATVVYTMRGEDHRIISIRQAIV